MSKIKSFLSNAGQALKLFNSLSKKDNPFNSPAFGDYGDKSTISFKSEKAQLHAYENMAWVSIALDRIMRDTGNREIFYTDLDGKMIDTKRVSDEITTPFKNGFANNPFLGGVLPSIIGQRFLTGNSYFLKYKSSAWAMVKDTYDQFVPLLPYRCKPVISKDNLYVVRYDFSLDGITWYQADPYDIIHFKQNTLFNPFIGVGNITKMRLTAEGDTAADEFNNEFMGRMAAPSLVVTDAKNDYSPEDYRRKSEMMAEQYQGKNNAGKILLITGEGADAKTLNVSQKDMQFLEVKRFSRETILSMFGTNEVVCGLLQNATVGNSDSQILLYLANTCNPVLEEIEQAFNLQFVQRIDPRVKLNFRKHTTGNITLVKDMIQNGIISPNRGAELLGEDADWDDISRASYYLPANYMPIDMVGSVPPAAPAKSLKKKTECDCGQDHAILNNPKNIDAICDFLDQKLTPPRRFQVQYFRTALKRRNKMEDAYVGQLENYLRDQEKRIMSKVRDIKALPIKLRAEGKSTDDIVDFIFDYDAENIEYRKTIIKLHTAGVQGAIADINGLASSYVSASMGNVFVKQAIDRLARQSIEFYDKAGNVYGVNRTSRGNLYKIVSDAMADSASTPEMTDKIRQYLETKVPEKYQETIPWRARMIARTESRAAWDAGAAVNYREIGVKYLDVTGCTQFEPDSDCGRQDIPIEQSGSLSFHPNHLGALVPSEIPV